jgi:hypothetical protein
MSVMLGNGDATIDSDVRHVITFRGFAGKVNITSELKNFFQFVYNPDKRRVSFVTEKMTNWRKPFSTTVFSTDPKIKEFNDEFLKSNPQIDFKNIQTFDMIADPNDTKLWKEIEKQLKNINLFPYLVFGTIFLFLWKMPKIQNKKKENKK